MAARRTTRPKVPKRLRAPVTSLTAQARQQFIRADLLAMQATAARTSQATKGIFGARPLRAAGDLSSYMLGPSPFTPPKSKPRRPPRRRR